MDEDATQAVGHGQDSFNSELVRWGFTDTVGVQADDTKVFHTRQTFDSCPCCGGRHHSDVYVIEQPVTGLLTVSCTNVPCVPSFLVVTFGFQRLVPMYHVYRIKTDPVACQGRNVEDSCKERALWKNSNFWDANEELLEVLEYTGSDVSYAVCILLKYFRTILSIF